MSLAIHPVYVDRMSTGAKKWILVTAGVLAGHHLAHAFAHDHANGAAHGYLTFAGLVVFPLALVAILDLAWREAAIGVRLIRVRELLIAQAAIFIAQELSEALVVGTAPMTAVSDPILWLGIATQIAAAGTVLTFVAIGRRFLSRIRWALDGEVFHAASSFLTSRSSRLAHRLLANGLPASRAPPVLV